MCAWLVRETLGQQYGGTERQWRALIASASDQQPGWQPGLLSRLVFKRLSTYHLEVWYVLASLMATGCLFSGPISWRVGSLSHCPGWLEPKDSLSACDSLIPRGFAWLLIFLTISRKSKPLPFIHLLFIIYLLKRSSTPQRQRTREEPPGDRGGLFCELPR